jgi:hypothetical protein
LPIGAAVLGLEVSRRPWIWMALLAIAAIPVFVMLPATAYAIVAILNRLEHMASLAGSLPVLGLWALFVAPLATLLVLHFDFLGGGGTSRRRWVAPALVALAAVAVGGWANATSGFGADEPRPTHIAYELNADMQSARWLSLENDLAAWTRQFFPEEPSMEPYEFSAGFERDAYAAAAPVADLGVPVAAVTSDRTANGVRTLELLLSSPRDSDRFEVHIEAGSAITAATLDGLAMDLEDYSPAADGELRFEYVSLPDAGVLLTLEIAGESPLDVTLKDLTYGLPVIEGFAIDPRPADAMPAPGLPLDGTTVVKAYTL